MIGVYISNTILYMIKVSGKMYLHYICQVSWKKLIFWEIKIVKKKKTVVDDLLYIVW